MHVTDRGRDQLGAFANEPFTRDFDYRFIREIDHSLTTLESQRIFMDIVCEWALRVAQGGPTSPRAQQAAPGRSAARVTARTLQAGALRPDLRP
ncbi:MAG: hypothetical protein WKG52_16290 [Variovorax sp.]